MAVVLMCEKRQFNLIKKKKFFFIYLLRRNEYEPNTHSKCTLLS